MRTDRFIPFRADMLAEVRAGRKTMTTRNKRYGDVGDHLSAVGGNFDERHADPHPELHPRIRLVAVERMPLCLVAERFYAQEGVASPQAFRDAWAEIHPGRGWTPELRVWVHTFALVEDVP